VRNDKCPVRISLITSSTQSPALYALHWNRPAVSAATPIPVPVR
jgi:hypothetical protein